MAFDSSSSSFSSIKVCVCLAIILFSKKKKHHHTLLTSSLPSLSNAYYFLSIKITNNNYLYRKIPSLPCLKGLDLLGFIDGSNLCPPSCINNVSIPWTKQDQHLKSLLISFLSDEIVPLVVSLSLSKRI